MKLTLPSILFTILLVDPNFVSARERPEHDANGDKKEIRDAGRGLRKGAGERRTAHHKDQQTSNFHHFGLGAKEDESSANQNYETSIVGGSQSQMGEVRWMNLGTNETSDATSSHYCSTHCPPQIHSFRTSVRNQLAQYLKFTLQI